MSHNFDYRYRIRAYEKSVARKPLLRRINVMYRALRDCTMTSSLQFDNNASATKIPKHAVVHALSGEYTLLRGEESVTRVRVQILDPDLVNTHGGPRGRRHRQHGAQKQNRDVDYRVGIFTWGGYRYAVPFGFEY